MLNIKKTNGQIITKTTGTCAAQNASSTSYGNPVLFLWVSRRPMNAYVVSRGLPLFGLHRPGEEPFVLGVQSALVPIRALVLPGPRSVEAFDAPQRTRGSLAEPAVPGGERGVRGVRPLLLEQPQGRRVALWLLAWPR